LLCQPNRQCLRSRHRPSQPARSFLRCPAKFRQKARPPHPLPRRRRLALLSQPVLPLTERRRLNRPLILCATARLAQTLRSAAPVGAQVWQTPPTLTLAQWLAQLADEALLGGLASLPQALDPFAERLLWEQVIGAAMTAGDSPLFDIQGMAASAGEAHALMRQWNLSVVELDCSAETQLFLGWQSEFLRRCQAGQWIDLLGQQLAVIGLIECGQLPIPSEIQFAGFDRDSPFESRLKNALRQRGSVVSDLPTGLSAASDQVQVLAYSDLQTECEALAEWVANKLAADPAQRLGVVVPDLAGARDRLAFALEDRLHPALIRPAAAEVSRSFNLSLGRPLADQLLVQAALELLALAAGSKVEQSRLGVLLNSPCWSAGVSEADGRARLDAAMRSELNYFTRIPSLLRLGNRLVESEQLGCAQTLADLTALQAAAEATGSRKRALADWATHFRAWLKEAAWPGERVLSSHEFQARRAFLETLDSLAALDAVLGKVTQQEAWRRLSQLCRQRVFQPETRGQPSIQVLGVLESAGLSFDALWVMGVSDDLWPPAPRPNPLLPAELLRAEQVAHASAEVELDFANRVQTRLLRSAPQIIFSYARGDGARLLRASPLLAGLSVNDGVTPKPASLAWQMAEAAGSEIESVADAMAPAVAEGEKVSGGTWLLRAQAICPAWGYFQFRLGAEAIEEAVEGLDPRARGTLVHGALEAFWRVTQDSASLHGYGEPALRQVIGDAVALALADFEQQAHQPLPARFRQLESKRLERLLDLWLALEKQREVDFSVLACEQEAVVEIEKIRVRMFVDRIDQLADGRRVIIDYKTGATIDTKNWASERISEPQLPIYAALASREPVAAVVFAKVLADKPAFSGIAEQADLLPGVRALGDAREKRFDPERFPDWPAVIEHWQERLHAVALEVRQGVAGVMVADENALAYCPVLPLLRLAERQRLLVGLAGEA
jgi:exodeoxyribonuclease-5